jgi:two-component system LytT family response regulator
MNVFIVDDEPLAVERLARMLTQSGRATIVGTATDPADALAALRSAAIDVLFLDIAMPGMSGFELLEALDRDVPVIFTTAYDQYALEAFAVNSIDYLLKPIEAARLEHALDKLQRLSDQPRADVRELARLLAARLAPPRRLERIASKIGDRITLIEVARIAYFAARDKLTFAAANGREHIVDFALSDLEQRLDSRRFVRIHRATIVNVAFVQELDAWVDGGVIVRLKDEKKTELNVARDRVRELKEKLGI